MEGEQKSEQPTANSPAGSIAGASDALMRAARQGMETVPCDCCGWPMPYQFYNYDLICPCCGFSPEADWDVNGYRERWDGRWWSSREAPPLIVRRLQESAQARDAVDPVDRGAHD